MLNGGLEDVDEDAREVGVGAEENVTYTPTRGNKGQRTTAEAGALENRRWSWRCDPRAHQRQRGRGGRGCAAGAGRAKVVGSE